MCKYTLSDAADALEAKELEIQQLQSALDQAHREIAALKSLPEERKEIIHRRQCLEGLDGIGTVSAQGVREDIDTLLQDCARWRSANAVLLVERDAARQACDKLIADNAQYAKRHLAQVADIERLHSQQPRPAAGADEEVETVRKELSDVKQYWAGNIRDIPPNVQRYFIAADTLLSALDRSAQECAKLQACEAALREALKSAEVIIAHLREEHELHLARKDLLAEAQERIAELKSDLSAQIAQRLESGSKFAECLARLNAAEARERGLRDGMQSLIRAYVRLLESGHDRIIMLGGQCDPVDRMERDDPNLRDARAILAAHPATVDSHDDLVNLNNQNAAMALERFERIQQLEEALRAMVDAYIDTNGSPANPNHIVNQACVALAAADERQEEITETKPCGCYTKYRGWVRNTTAAGVCQKHFDEAFPPEVDKQLSATVDGVAGE